MQHIIVCSNGTGRKAICGERMPVSKPTGAEFHYRFGESDLAKRELPAGLDCSTCLAVGRKVRQGILLSYAVREARR